MPELSNRDGIINALIDYGMNLSINPYGQNWRQIPYYEYENRVDRWVQFIQEHPDYGQRCREYIWKLLEKTISYEGWTTSKERRKCLKELRLKADNLPDKTVLTKDFISMKLFVDFGINTFSLRRTRIGNAIRKVMADIRGAG